MVAGDLLLVTQPGGPGTLDAYDKRSGKKIGTTKMPAPGQYGMMSYMHQGKQYIVVQIGGAQYPGSLVALALPDAK